MFVVREICKAVDGRLRQGDGAVKIRGVSIDSRTVRPGDVFIAIRGKRQDGHKYLPQAIKNGAAALIVSKKVSCPKDVAVIEVRDTTKALGMLAAFHRQRFDVPVITITGSTGKTTTKDMVAAVLQSKLHVLKSEKSENNQFGLPLTLLRLTKSHDVVVLEAGTNQPGDIRWLSRIARPTVAVFTNIGESHLERLKSPSGVLREKQQLLKGMPRGSWVILNGDDPYLHKMTLKQGGYHVIRYGIAHQADYRAIGISVDDKGHVHFRIGGRACVLKTPARHCVENALAAISCGRLFKIQYNALIAGLQAYAFHSCRQEMQRIGKALLIDDTYNANPVSFKAAVRTLDDLRTQGKKVLIAADMLELGSKARQLHEAVGNLIARSSVDVVLTTGTCAGYLTRAVCKNNPRIEARHYSDLNRLHARLKALGDGGNIFLVKGSRGMRMERTVEFLKEHLQKRK